MRARSGPVSCDQSVCIRWGQCGVACFSRCDYSDPALLPSGWLSVKGAAEERHSRGCLEKSMHMLPRSLRGFRSRLPPCLFSCSFLIIHRHTDSAPASDSTLTFFSSLSCCTVRSPCTLLSSIFLSSPPPVFVYAPPPPLA